MKAFKKGSSNWLNNSTLGSFNKTLACWTASETKVNRQSNFRNHLCDHLKTMVRPAQPRRETKSLQLGWCPDVAQHAIPKKNMQVNQTVKRTLGPWLNQHFIPYLKIDEFIHRMIKILPTLTSLDPVVTETCFVQSWVLPFTSRHCFCDTDLLSSIASTKKLVGGRGTHNKHGKREKRSAFLEKSALLFWCQMYQQTGSRLFSFNQ